MWCIPGNLDREYIERMEDILDLLEMPAKPLEPVLCLDERPVQLHSEVRPFSPARPGRIARRDSEYRRCGTANVFAIVNAKQGHHITHATRDRTGVSFARALKTISTRYPEARRIHIIMDNLNTHAMSSCIQAFGETAGRRLWKRFVPHYTPKHASWLNPAEIEISLFSREALGKDRIADFGSLHSRIASWNKTANTHHRKIEWTFTSHDARRKFRYRRRGVRITLARH